MHIKSGQALLHVRLFLHRTLSFFICLPPVPSLSQTLSVPSDRARESDAPNSIDTLQMEKGCYRKHETILDVIVTAISITVTHSIPDF